MNWVYQGNIARWIRVLGFRSSVSLPFRSLTGRVGISARYRIPGPLDLWRRALDWVSALYSMIGKFLLFNRQRSPQCLHHTLNEFSALMRQQVPEPCWDQRVARRPRSAGRQQGGPTQLHEPIPHEPIPNARHTSPHILNEWHIRKAKRFLTMYEMSGTPKNCNRSGCADV
jgi:hypothetical protein